MVRYLLTRIRMIKSFLFASQIPHHSKFSGYSYFPSPRTFSKHPCIVRCKKSGYEDDRFVITRSSAYDVLGVEPNCSQIELKAAFRSKVKQFHPDVYKDDAGDSNQMIRRVLLAYEILLENLEAEISERECVDPFDEPECEAYELFVNETLCAGKGCSYSCVNAAPYLFSFNSYTEKAKATSQGYVTDNQVQLAVSQCPRKCIHYVTPSQRVVLEELLDGIMSAPYISPDEANCLYSLIVKAEFENNRYSKPKKQPKSTTKNVDLF